MNPKVALISSITLLYREAQLTQSNDSSGDLIRKVIAMIKTPEFSGGLDEERDLIIGLKELALSMASAPPGTPFETAELIQKVRIIARNDESIYVALREGVDSDLTSEELKRCCISLRNTISNYMKEEEINKIVHEASRDLKFNRDKIESFTDFVTQLYSKIEPFTIISKDSKDPAVNSEVDFTDENSVASMFEKAEELNNDAGILKTGWQGMNNMTNGGIRRGEFITTFALQHNFKTGGNLCLFRQLPTINKPFMLDERKKPAIVRLSFENPMATDLPLLYAGFYENENQVRASWKGKDAAELASYCTKRFNVNGYRVIMKHVDPTQWTYRSIINFILELEAEGYEIHALFLDYLAMVPTTGCTEGPMGSDKRDMFRRLRNFTQPRGIAVITPHQISTEAKTLIRNGEHEDFVKIVANKGYADGCRALDNELDLEMYWHICEEPGDGSYLTFQRGKHRGQNLTPKEYFYWVMKFGDFHSGILDDYYGAPQWRKRVGAGPVGTKGETPYWSNPI